MKIGVDLDGTVSKVGLCNPSLRLTWWLFIFLIPLVLFIKPNQRAVKKIREMKDLGHEIIIVSARPPWATKLTTRWLISHRVPFDKILCVGFGRGTKKRKLRAIKETGIEHLFDDNEELVAFLRRNSISATRL